MRQYIFIAVLLCVVAISYPVGAVVFFDSDFEGGSVEADGWPPVGGNPSQMQVVQQFPLTGAFSLKRTWVDGSGTSQAWIERFYTFTKHVFLRTGFRWEPGFCCSDNGLSKLVALYAVDSMPAFWVYLRNGSNTYEFHPYAPYDRCDIEVFLTGVTASTTGYDQIEVEGLINDPGQSNGLYRVWINGNLVVESLNRQLVGPTPSSTTCFDTRPGEPAKSTAEWGYILNYVQSGVGIAYQDRLAVGDTRIGTVGDPGPDTTPPNPVTGITVE